MEYDYIIIGSGFGGSVSALRLAEKGYKVLVIEKGRWFTKDDFPKTNWNLRKWLWIPFIRFFGIMRISFFQHLSLITGNGVGGGSLVYANTLPIPAKDFFNTGSWKDLADWEKELKPFYTLANKMMGASTNPRLEKGEQILKEIAIELGREDQFEATNIGVTFGETDEIIPDPYFNGEGPDVYACNFCGGCMTGCRHGAKNTLDRNYLWLAQKRGVEILAETKVVNIKPEGSARGEDGYTIRIKSSTRLFKKKRSIKTGGLIISGGVLGSMDLLLKLKKKSLPGLSDYLGHDIRTNNESLAGIVSLDKNIDFSKGVAIGAILKTDDNSHLEPVRYGKGSGFWRLGMLPFTLGNNIFQRVGKMIKILIAQPIRTLKIMFIRNYAQRTQVLLFMQHLESTLCFKRGKIRLRTSIGKGPGPTPFMKEAKELADKFGSLINGRPHVFALEPLFGIPSTAHILGGAVMGESEANGVIDEKNHVFGYENMLICDGSMISANPGVNPALSIMAITERAMDLMPEKVEKGK